MSKNEVTGTFEKSKDTKNTTKYVASDEEAGVMTKTIYINHGTLPDPTPEQITVSVSW